MEMNIFHRIAESFEFDFEEPFSIEYYEDPPRFFVVDLLIPVIFSFQLNMLRNPKRYHNTRKYNL